MTMNTIPIDRISCNYFLNPSFEKTEYSDKLDIVAANARYPGIVWNWIAADRIITVTSQCPTGRLNCLFCRLVKDNVEVNIETRDHSLLWPEFPRQFLSQRASYAGKSTLLILSLPQLAHYVLISHNTFKLLVTTHVHTQNVMDFDDTSHGDWCYSLWNIRIIFYSAGTQDILGDWGKCFHGITSPCI